MVQTKQNMQKIYLILLFLLGVMLFAAPQVSAISNVGPDPADNSASNVYFTVARPGVNYRLNNPESVVKIFSRTASGTLTVVDGSYCPREDGGIDSVKGDGDGIGNDGDGHGQPITNFSIIRANASEAITATVVATGTNFFKPNPCGDRNIALSYSGLVRSTIPGHEDFYVGYFKAELAVGGVWDTYTIDSINGFKVQLAAGNVVSTYSGASDQFAQGQMWIDVNTYASMNLKFAPPCTLTSATTVTLRWFDADIGESNQPIPIPTTLRRYNASTGALISSTNFSMTGGQDAPGSRAITVHPGSRYTWEVRDVYSRNGIQYKLPYDSFNFNQVCKPIITEFKSIDPAPGCKELSVRVDTLTGGQWVARLIPNPRSSTAGPPSEADLLSTALNPGTLLSPNRNDNGQHIFNIENWQDVRARTFAVRVRDNGNGASSVSGLITVGPCLVPTCNSPPSSLNYSPSSPQPNEAFTMTLNLGFRQTYGANAPTNTVGSSAQPSLAYSVTYQNTGPPPGFSPGSGTVNKPAGSAGIYSTSFSGISATAVGTYYGDIVINTSASGGPTITCPFGVDNESPPCLVYDPVTGDCPFDGPTIEAQPFFQAFRGDVISGAPIYNDLDGMCYSGTGAISANNDGPPGYKGSGAQLGVLASDQVKEFISASLRTASPNKPNGLTFANTPTNGGFVSLSQSCTNYFGGYDSSTATNTDPGFFASAAAPALTPGLKSVLHHSGKLQVSGYAAILGNMTIYVDGDLYVTSNIAYAVVPYLSVNQLPSVKFIVKGNIYIDPNVTRLDGTYIAVPIDASNGGNVFTCAPSGAEPSYDALKSTCVVAPQLKVYGSIIARYIHLHRLTGTGNDANPADDYGSTRAAETFVESPLNWLALPADDASSGFSDYESITSLPPVL